MEKTETNKIRNEKGKITTNTKVIQESSETTLNTYIKTNWKT
jgi:hypothetical protein